MNLIIATSYLFLIPFFLALYRKKYIYSIPYLLVTLTSVIYHTTNDYCSIDVFAAYLVIFTNLIYIILHYTEKKKRCILSMIFAITGFIIYFKCLNNKENYYILHSIWHIIVALGTAVLYL